MAIVVFGLYTVIARPYAPSTGYMFPTPGPTIVVHFGEPVESAVACAAGGTAYAERIPWVNATHPVTTGDVTLRVYEIADGDYIGDPNAVANVTPSNPCNGLPPSLDEVWYAALAAPDGTNVLTYTVDQGWAPVTPGPSNVTIENGSTVVLVTHASLAGTGRGFSVFGIANDSVISGSVPL